MVEPPQGKMLGKVRPKDADLINTLGNELAKFNRRLSLIENRIDGIQDHLNLVDDNLIDKYKTTISDINALQLDAQNMRGQVQEISELLKRLASRLNDFASKDDVKVLERYADYWSPLNYVTKEEVDRMIKSITDGTAPEKIDKVSISNMIKEHLPAKTQNISQGLSKEDVSNLISAEIKKIKPAEKSLSKDDVLQIVKDSLKELPKSSGKGLSESDVINITKKHIEDLFGKI